MRYIKPILTISSLLIVINCFSQQSKESAGKGLIIGSVIDDKTKLPIEFATIAIFKSIDSTLVTGIVTDPKGQFKITEVPFGDFYAKVDFIGYSSKTITNISISKEKLKHAIPVVSLGYSSIAMKEFEMVAEKELVEVKIDKTVYNVSKDITSQGSDALDVLRNMPSVDVDVEDNISLRGDNSVRILIDGRPSNISPAELLKNLPASAIEKVEVITNPSAKNDPSGMSGIINIVLKKEKAQGFNGTASGSLGYSKTEKYNGSLSLNFRKNKWNIYGSAGFRGGSRERGGVTNREFLLIDSAYFQDLISSRIRESLSFSYSGGVDYFLNKKNTLYASVNISNRGGDNNSNNSYDFLDNTRTIVNSSNRFSGGNSISTNTSYNAGWQKEFKKEGHTLDLDASYSTHNSDQSSNISERFFYPNDVEFGTPAKQNTIEEGKGKTLRTKLDYTLPINDSLELEMGLHFTSGALSSGFFSETLIDSSDIFLPDVNLNNDFDYNQQVTAFYTTLGKQFNKLGIKLGGRLENTMVNSELKTTKEVFKQDYISFFPSVHLSYQLVKSNKIQLSYSRRINRPSQWEVNPFASYSDPFNLRMGNPQLKPEYINVFEVAYLKQFKKLTLSSSVYYRQIMDKKTRSLSTDSTGILVSSYNNFGESTVVGTEVIARYRPTKKWRLSGTFNYFNTTFKDLNLAGDINSNTDGWSLQFSSSQSFKKGWAFQLNGRYSPKQKTLQGTKFPRYGLTVAVAKSILKRKGNISLKVRDVFKTQNYHFISTDLGNYSYESFSTWESQSVYLTFRYSFGTSKNGNQKRRSKNNNAGDNFSIPSGDEGG